MFLLTETPKARVSPLNVSSLRITCRLFVDVSTTRISPELSSIAYLLPVDEKTTTLSGFVPSIYDRISFLSIFQNAMLPLLSMLIRVEP